MRLQYYVAKRLALMVLVLLGVSIISFVVVRVVPSSPEAMLVGAHARPEEMAKARVELGLDKPIYVQYLIYVESIIHGDLGISLKTKRPVLQDLWTYWPATFELTTVAMVIAVIIGVPLGVVSAVRKDSFVDHFSRVFALSGVSIPIFWMGMLLQLVFFSSLRVLPLSGRIDADVMYSYPVTAVTGVYLFDTLITGNIVAFVSCLKHIFLPAITLAYASLATTTRMTRSSMLEVLRENYARAARSFGLPERTVVYKLCLRNALIPTITVVGLSYGVALGGTFLVESIFGWPGLGLYMAEALVSFDYPAIVGVTLLYACLYVIVNLIVDLLYAFVDPRVRL
jgi:peptide/nickel transport system permease protein